VIFGCSPNCKCRSKGPDLSQEKTLCGTRRPSCTRFHKKLSRNVSSNGRTAGRSVCITKETTLKGIRVSDVKINNCILPTKGPILFVQPTYVVVWFAADTHSNSLKTSLMYEILSYSLSQAFSHQLDEFMLHYDQLCWVSHICSTSLTDLI